mmetsp:Transcript_22614/g.33474  ORF Transcript_22614/g.33474 Transcript_22614/m.33474 type:complete len:91 (-) Transcript_22614:330-602(-)
MEQALRWLQEDEDISSSNIDVGSARSSVVRTSGNNTNAGQIFLAAVIFASLAGVIYSISHVLNRNYDAKKSAKGMPGEGDKMIPKETEMV